MSAVNGGVVPDARTVFQYGLASAVRTVDDGTILDIDLIADGDGSDIAPDYAIEPTRRVLTHGHVPDDGRVGCKPTCRMDFRRLVSAGRMIGWVGFMSIQIFATNVDGQRCAIDWQNRRPPFRWKERKCLPC